MHYLVAPARETFLRSVRVGISWGQKEGGGSNAGKGPFLLVCLGLMSAPAPSLSSLRPRLGERDRAREQQHCPPEGSVVIGRDKLARLHAAASKAGTESRQMKRALHLTRAALASVVNELASSKKERESGLMGRVEKLLSVLEDKLQADDAAAVVAVAPRSPTPAPPAAAAPARASSTSPSASSSDDEEGHASPTFARDAIARLDHAQLNLMSRRSVGGSSGSPLPAPRLLQVTQSPSKDLLQQQLSSARDEIQALETKNAQLRKDVQLALLAMNKTTQSRQLAAAFAARSTKLKLDATLSAIKAEAAAATPSARSASATPELSSPRAQTPRAAPWCLSTPSLQQQQQQQEHQQQEQQQFGGSLSYATPAVPCDGELDVYVRRLTGRLDELQQQLDQSEERGCENERKIRTLVAAATAGEKRVQELERQNAELLLLQGAHARDEAAERGARRVATLEARLRSEQDARLALRGKLRVQVEALSQAAGRRQVEQALRVLMELLDMPPPTATTATTATATVHANAHANKENISSSLPPQAAGGVKDKSQAVFAALFGGLKSPTVVKPVSPMERRLTFSPSTLR